MPARLIAPAIALLSLIIAFTTHAEPVEEVLTNGLLAEASYHQGEPGKPAVILLHGFLTVHTFNLISDISNELADNGYTVLAPTLTLGISRRKSTLDCNALHLHSMEKDLQEIEWWVNWLIKKGHKNIILMGHSSGAVQMTSYASTQKHKEVNKLVALSMIPLNDMHSKNFQDSYQAARSKIKSGNDDIYNYTLAYCTGNYAAPPKEFMSYAKLDNEYIAKTLRSVKIPKSVIMGSEDIPVSATWPQDLKQSGAHVDIIEGADHFFGNGTEFELFEAIVQKIK
jgi:esterase/lipase